LPKRILIQGGGYIAVEFRRNLRRLGSRRHAGLSRREILRGFDDDVREHLRFEMGKHGIKIITQQTVAGSPESRARIVRRIVRP
jgi:glutathione reductase (NADPH)